MRWRPFLVMSVAVGMLATAAVADHPDSKDNSTSPSPSAGRGGVHPGPDRASAPRRGIVTPQGPGESGDRSGHPHEGKFLRRDGVYFWPYPYPWPYGGYYGNYGNPYATPYPYPYQYQYYPDDDSMSGMPSTRGLVVPGDLPMGATGNWYYCDNPDGFYPYVKSCNRNWTPIPLAPPPPGASAPLSYSDWQWCEESKSFFPYVSSCKEGFAPVPVTVPAGNGGTPPQTANWFFCDEPRGYSPYVVQCKHDWRAVPAVPPPSVKITVRDEASKADSGKKKK